MIVSCQKPPTFPLPSPTCILILGLGPAVARTLASCRIFRAVFGALLHWFANPFTKQQRSLPRCGKQTSGPEQKSDFKHVGHAVAQPLTGQPIVAKPCTKGSPAAKFTLPSTDHWHGRVKRDDGNGRRYSQLVPSSLSSSSVAQLVIREAHRQGELHDSERSTKDRRAGRMDRPSRQVSAPGGRSCCD
jgi:hypothetical protein